MIWFIICWLACAAASVAIWKDHFDTIEEVAVAYAILSGPIGLVTWTVCTRKIPHRWRRIEGTSEFKSVSK